MLEQLSARLRRIDLSKTALRIVKQESYVAIDLNTEEQLFGRGIDSNGNSLGEYAPLTIQIKKEKGQPYDHVTLKDEGDFYNDFYMDADKWPAEIHSKNSKTRKLEEQYGSGIFGLTRNSTDQFTSHVQEPLAKAIEEEILTAFRDL